MIYRYKKDAVAEMLAVKRSTPELKSWKGELASNVFGWQWRLRSPNQQLVLVATPNDAHQPLLLQSTFRYTRWIYGSSVSSMLKRMRAQLHRDIELYKKNVAKVLETGEQTLLECKS